MPRITTPVAGYTGEVVGVSFTDGVGETTDDALLGYFRRHGYRIDEQDESVEIPEGKPSRQWNKPQLAAYAEREDIDLGDASTKDDILAVLSK